MDFMLKLKDIANDCSFTNSDETVKFLFLTHNQNSRVKDALLDKMKGTSTLTKCLAIAKSVESTIKTEKLSKTFLQNVNKPETTDIDEVNKSKRHNQIGDSIVVPVAKVVKDKVSVEIVVKITHPGNALPMGRNASDARSPITSRNSGELINKTGHRVEEVLVGMHVKTCMNLKREAIYMQCMNMML